MPSTDKRWYDKFDSSSFFCLRQNPTINTTTSMSTTPLFAAINYGTCTTKSSVISLVGYHVTMARTTIGMPWIGANTAIPITITTHTPIVTPRD